MKNQREREFRAACREYGGGDVLSGVVLRLVTLHALGEDARAMIFDLPYSGALVEQELCGLGYQILDVFLDYTNSN